MELLNIKNYVKERKESLKKHSKGASITISYEKAYGC